MTKKLFAFFALIVLSFLLVGCTKQLSCKNVIDSILKENKTLDINTTRQLMEQKYISEGSIYPKFAEGNRGINPPISYFAIFIYNESDRGYYDREYYYVNGGFYSQKWHGPYKGNTPAECRPPSK
jgi:hypothetical protein